MKRYFLPTTDAGRLAWLANIAQKLELYALKYGISPEEVADMKKAYVFYLWALEIRRLVADYEARVIAFKREMSEGIKAGATPSAPPVTLVLPTMPEAVPPGIFARATSIGNRIKNHVAFTEADGRDLGLFGAASVPDYSTLKPELSVSCISGQAKIEWKKNNMPTIEIMVDRGDGVFALLAIADGSPYVDSYVLPAGVSSVVCRYKAIYRKNNERVGEWSDIVESVIK